ncbi:MAG TPA: (2Fe-2S)-binding protein [Bryobacteraceae bacterium]|nr:(2Fe-2S)-binding protein [Bryobacteraceae bacterium]
MDLVANGERHRLNVDPERPLLFVLRNELDLTGTKYGCGEGECGACTVLIDGVPRRSCRTPVSAAAGKQITTIEGLEDAGRLHAVQQAFIDADAMQCAYCTSGMILSAVALLHRNPTPTDEQIRRAMEGNICRCGAYNRIVAAVRKASTAITARAEAPHA